MDAKLRLGDFIVDDVCEEDEFEEITSYTCETDRQLICSRSEDSKYQSEEL